MPSLTGKKPSDAYKRLLQINQSSNTGVDATTRNIQDGDGGSTVASISDDQFSRICFRRNLRVGVYSPSSTVRSRGRIVNFLICSGGANFPFNSITLDSISECISALSV